MKNNLFQKKPVIVFYESAEDLKIKRFQRFNKLLMIDCEVGCDFEDFENREQKVQEFMAKKMYSDALAEMENRRQMIYHAYEEYSPKHFALALMVKSIDGEEFTDMSEKTLLYILDKLDRAGYTQKQLSNDVTDVKKKSLRNWRCIFPIISKKATTIITTFFSSGYWKKGLIIL